MKLLCKIGIHKWLYIAVKQPSIYSNNRCKLQCSKCNKTIMMQPSYRLMKYLAKK